VQERRFSEYDLSEMCVMARFMSQLMFGEGF